MNYPRFFGGSSLPRLTIPRCFRNQMQKKVEHKLTSKKITDILADTLGMKKWENESLIIIT